MAEHTAADAGPGAPQQITPDLCVIGAGAGGLTAAAAAAAFGSNVVLIEKSRMAGNAPDEAGREAIYGGALPAQALIAAAERAHAVRAAPRFGVKTVRFGVDFAGVRARVQEVVAAVAPLRSRERFAGMGVRVIAGVARFTDRETIAVNDIVVKARRFIIATGSSPQVPTIPGLADGPYLTSENIFDLDECPRHLIVLGGGAMAIEMAQAFRRLGADVTVLCETAPLGDYDAECAALVIDGLVRDGVALRNGVRATGVHRAHGRVQVDVANVDVANDVGGATSTVEGSHLLVATGRQPNIAALDLDKARIRHGADGISVDKRLRTSNPHVYAIGDAIDGPKWTHAAQHQAGLVIRHALFRVQVDADDLAIPRVTFTDPEMAQIGLTEDEVRSESFRILRWPYSENERAQATGNTFGQIKAVTDSEGGILGVTLVGAGAAENIAVWTLAMNQDLNIEALAGVIVPYPTYAEVGKRAAMTYFKGGLTSPLVRGIMNWLRRFG
ncbi:MAG TPA: FAD-dependent oxidoreductase [Xanthobacteraceae bacterium]|nr:FAD-dependent oxidoreductase [Xanthobacteraceae bacterium]